MIKIIMPVLYGKIWQCNFLDFETGFSVEWVVLYILLRYSDVYLSISIQYFLWVFLCILPLLDHLTSPWPNNSQWSTSSWTNQQNPLSRRAGAHVNAELTSDSSLHTIGLLCCLLLASFQLTSLIGYRMRALYLIGQIKCYLSVLFSCKILYTLSICKWLEEKREK